MKKKNLIEQPLTDKQKKFANLYVQESGLLSKTEIAVKAGYDKESAYQRAYELTNPSISPHVVRYIKKIELDFAEKNQITKENHIAELWRLKQEAREKGMAGIALRAEELRGKLMGYYIDKSMTLNVREKSMEELEQEIKDKLKLWKPVLNEKKKK
tara:strand:+ start:352 stop:819 length:468 start_codon:yes stop_codon:yes gene_type:complete